jgi:hypothetical protein
MPVNINVPPVVPVPPGPQPYNRTNCLALIAEAAIEAIKQDSSGNPEEDLELSSRLAAIQAQVIIINANDPLLK